MPSSRNARLAHQLQQEIAMILHRELKDPRLGFVTVTRVELSADLSHAKVFFSCLGNQEQRGRSHDALEHAVPFIRNLIKKRLRLKLIPALAFRYDETIEDSVRLGQTLDELTQDG